MSNLSKRIYRKIIGLIPDLHSIQPYNKVDLPDFSNVHFIVLDTSKDQINLILTRHKNENGRLISDPSIEISVDPNKNEAKVMTYKDVNYFHSVVPRATDIGTIGIGKASSFLLAFLKELKR